MLYNREPGAESCSSTSATSSDSSGSSSVSSSFTYPTHGPVYGKDFGGCQVCERIEQRVKSVLHQNFVQRLDYYW